MSTHGWAVMTPVVKWPSRSLLVSYSFVPTDRMRQIDPICRLAAGPPLFVIIGGSVCWLLSVSSTFPSTVYGTSQH
jgi:hypothetical protein